MDSSIGDDPNPYLPPINQREETATDVSRLLAGMRALAISLAYYVATPLVSWLISFMCPADMSLEAAMFLILGCLAVATLAMTATIAFLGWLTSGPWIGTVLGILSLVPLLNFLIAMEVNRRAITLLRRVGHDTSGILFDVGS